MSLMLIRPLDLICTFSCWESLPNFEGSFMGNRPTVLRFKLVRSNCLWASKCSRSASFQQLPKCTDWMHPMPVVRECRDGQKIGRLERLHMYWTAVKPKSLFPLLSPSSNFMSGLGTLTFLDNLPIISNLFNLVQVVSRSFMFCNSLL